MSGHEDEDDSMRVQHFISNEYGEVTDGMLAQRARDGEQEAFELLVKRYYTLLFHFIYHFLGEYDFACDIVQQVFMQLYLSLPTLHTSMPLKPWLFCVARHRCIDEIRRRHRHSALVFSQLETTQSETEELPSLIETPDPEPLPEEQIEAQDTRQRVEQVIQALPPKFREVVLLRYASQLTFPEIAQTLQLPLATVKTYFQRAKPMLRALLEQEL
jgi:RNA polymerase sigma factor (sigma-70 family)